MDISKYKKHIILLVIIYIFILSIAFLPYQTATPPFLTFIPGDTLFQQIPLIFVFISIFALIGGIFVGYLLAPLFLLIHKKVIGIRFDYGIQTRAKPEKFKESFKTFFPALLAINLALMFAFNQSITNALITQVYLESNNGDRLAPLVTFVGLLIITSAIAMGLFSPVWFLLESGIVYTNKKKVLNKMDPIEVRSVGGWYMVFMKGYAGISVIISYITFSQEIFARYGDNSDALIPALIALPLLPFCLMILFWPTLIVMDMTTEHRKNFILKFAKRLGITEPLEAPLDITL